ncbi:hypothetical protein BFJ63_vAg9946 [Fusarium oxysporum f. sp. narcissi]|uniref:Uncharacterized protein n=2 Tax=Fusarium oxysporum TaxID=5507 RepID=A0A4Q2VL47_FUSOX|nr:hypothetical protein BFJ65_g16681 [Fusarium oxysporum f. sp. cepae]RKK45371.1 hypothetical protein BFJ66_g9137 [Fusarium oxysporum f. sp. cepae]RKK45389.1 hypothetical protein BFJ67_g8676 [Fusarium oxysporum f. sp. cepae]RYC87136.1 hypothetical protein BFJ63_vAg9946 [Fusarium oxysporum f. sp. narcissi]
MSATLQSPSRLGLQLQDYDQVIALSQGNINETLELHFMRNEKLHEFKAIFPTYGLKGKLSSPLVHLIDKENADQAIFYLNFESGKYYYFEQPSDTPRFDEDGLPLPVGQPTRVTVDVAGWSLAFFVDFSFKRMATIPDKIRKSIELPGSYSVNQLLIDFGTPDILNIAWDHCKTPGVPEAQKATCRAEIRMFLGTHLESVLLKENDHNILGYAVKIDAPSDGKTEEQRLKELSEKAAHFPPTSVRLQTINYRPDGKEVQTGSEESDHNAFLFTEMTQFRKMPNQDLQWSGDWFYNGIGGTLAMSGGIFLDQYLAEKLQPTIAGPWKMANHIGSICADFSDDVVHFNFNGDEEWILKRPRMTTLNMKRGNSVQMTYHDVDENSVRWDDSSRCVEYLAVKEHYWYNKAELSCVVEPQVGTGKITTTTELKTDTQRTVKSAVGTWDLQLVCKIQWSTTIDLRAIETDARLLVGAESKEPIVHVDIVKDIAKVDGAGEVAESWERLIKEMAEDRKKSPLEGRVTRHIERFENELGSMAHTLEEALNQQGRFIFPGGGTFDMKDPIFSKEGDLLIGLTFREGA